MVWRNATRPTVPPLASEAEPKETMMPQTPSTTPEQRASIEKVLNILQDLRAQRSAMTVSQAIALLRLFYTRVKASVI